MRKAKGAGIAAAVIGLAAGESSAHAESQPREETHVIGRSEYLRFPEHQRTQQGVEALHGAVGAPGERSMRQESEVRERALADGTAKRAIDIIAHLPEEKPYTMEVQDLEIMLSTVNAQGVVYREYRARFGHLQKHPDPVYYGSHLRDFAPTSSDIRPEDVDPRIGWRTAPGEAEAIGKDNLRQDPGWSSAARFEKFKRMVDDQNVRNMADTADLTLAEYFSLIKAVIKEAEELKHIRGQEAVQADPAFATLLQAETLQLPQEKIDKLIAKVLLEKREQLAKAEILGPSTNDFIILTGRDNGSMKAKTTKKNSFDPQMWVEIANAAGVPDNAVHSYDASTSRPEVALERMLRAVRNSTGETVIALETHGSPQDIAVSMDDDTNLAFGGGDLAASLVQRIMNEKDKESLSHVTIVLDSCSGYDFAQHLTTQIRRHWVNDQPQVTWGPENTISPNELAMPRILTTAQEGSLGVMGSGFGDGLRKSLSGIRKDRAVTGKRLLQEVQPSVYPQNDMTFFLPGHGRLLELGANEQEKDSAPT